MHVTITYCNASHKLPYLHEKYICYTPVRRQVTAPHKHPTSQYRQNAIARLLTIEIINNYYKHAKIKSPFQNFTHSWVIKQCLTGDRAVIAGSPPGVCPFIGIGGSPFDDTGSIVRSSNRECQISVRSPVDLYRYISYGGPQIAARGPDGVPRGAAG